MELKIKNNRISFDFDGTLTHHFDGGANVYIKETRDFVLRLIRRGYEVYIITRRYGPENSHLGLGNEHEPVLKLAKELGIQENRIIFTNREWKYSTIKELGICMHIDDDEREKYWIERHLPEVDMIYLGDNNWDEQLIDVIDEHDKIGIWFNKPGRYSDFSLVIMFIIFFIGWYYFMTHK